VSTEPVESVEPSIGWGVLHLFFVVDRDHAEPLGAQRALDAIVSLEADGHQALVFAVLGHKADLGIVALGPDLARLQAFQQELATTPLALVDSYVSLTELSEYTATEDQERDRLTTEEGVASEELDARLAAWGERMAHYQENRLHPRLPAKKLICFYPMSKRREADANWYALPFEERRRIMAGHARIGRTYAGRVVQLITGSLGFDDWEWGVTLVADDPVTFKEIVYEMRFDEASARYAEFGPFITGLLLEPADAMARVGLPDAG
jgi:chlorite dismutase